MSSVADSTRDFSDIKYTLVQGPTVLAERFGPATGSVVYHVARRDAVAFLNALCPQPYKKQGVVYMDRATAPEVPGGFCPTKVSIDPLTDAKPFGLFGKGGEAFNDTAVFTVEYSTSLEARSQGTLSAGGSLDSTPPEYYLEPSSNATVEMLSVHITNKTLAGDDMQTKGQVVPDFAAPVIKVLPVIERNFRWNWAVDPDLERIMGVLGSVNANSPRWLGYPRPETVLFLGFSIKTDYRWRIPKGLSSSIISWPATTIDFKFAERRITDTIQPAQTDDTNAPTPNTPTEPASPPDKYITWNHFFNPQTQTWQRLQRDTGTTLEPLYQLRIFEANIFDATLTFEENEALGIPQPGT